MQTYIASSTLLACILLCLIVGFSSGGKGQKVQKRKKHESASTHYHNTPDAKQVQVLQGIDGIHVINLARRSDRMTAFITNSTLPANSFHRFEAFDSKTLQLSPQILRLFSGNKWNSISGVVACCYSHLALWKIVANTRNEVHLIFEDDAQFSKDWIRLWNEQLHPNLPPNITLLYFGGVTPYMAQRHTMSVYPFNRHFNEPALTQLFQKNYDPPLDETNPAYSRYRFFYTAIAYAISSRAARVLVQLVDDFGFERECDQMLIKLMDLPETQDGVYSTNPLLVHPPEHSSDYHSKDTDIWSSTVSFSGIPYGQPWWDTYTKAELDDLLGITSTQHQNDQSQESSGNSDDLTMQKNAYAHKRRRNHRLDASTSSTQPRATPKRH